MDSSTAKTFADLAAQIPYPVFPCNERDDLPKLTHKAPLTGKGGFKNATRDPRQIASWSKKHPNALVGVPTGEITGLFVLDVDHKNGADGFATLKANGVALPPTRAHKTASGGVHYLFKHRPGLTCSTGKIGLGVDTRGDGGYIIFWPLHGHEVSNPDLLAEVPEWIVEALEKKHVSAPQAMGNRPDEARIVDALKYVSAEPYGLWVKMGMAVKSELGEAGFHVWDAWSRTCPEKYDASATAKKWGELKPEGGITIGTLYHEAKKAKERVEGFHSGFNNSDVTDVTGVQANSDAVSAVTSGVFRDVTGVTTEPSNDNRPCFLVRDGWTKVGKAEYRPGVWYFDIRPGKKKDASPALTETWVCSPLHVEAVTFDSQSNNFGRLLRFKNTLGRWREWAMPMELLRGSGDDLRGELLAMGVEINPAAKVLLANYLQAAPPKRRMRCALQVGWNGDSFVLPDAVIGPNASGVIFQSGERGHDEYTVAGTLDGWRAEIAARAVDNPMLALALSASFAGPLLARCNAESGGFHFVGGSSTGKTTAVEAACSVWGGPDYRRSWRATANGMEGAAALFNDCLLAVDEISECDPKEVGAIVYALGNGRGKQRATRSGAARSIARWRCFVLSSGERTIATTMQEGGRLAKGGVAVRLLDIPAARTFGLFDTLHGMESGAALSGAIKGAAVAHHGRAGRAFLERLTRDTRGFSALLERIKALPEFAVETGEGQDNRAAGRFALVAMAGELATEYGLTGWPEGEAIKAAGVAFTAWRSLRGRGSDDRRQILERISDFLERNGDARFSSTTRFLSDDTYELPVRDRAGWWEGEGETRTYLFTAGALREAVKGFDFKRALDVLQEAGVIPAPGDDGVRAKIYRLGGRTMRLYPVSAEKLLRCQHGEHGA